MPVSRRAMLAGSAAAVAAPLPGIAVPELRRSAGGASSRETAWLSASDTDTSGSTQNGIVYNPSLLSGYYDDYVTRVWNKYEPTTLTIDTRAFLMTSTGAKKEAGHARHVAIRHTSP